MKETSIQILARCFFGTLVFHLLGLLAFRVKLLILRNTLSLDWLASCAASSISLDSVTGLWVTMHVILFSFERWRNRGIKQFVGTANITELMCMLNLLDMPDFAWPHRLLPARLLRPWDVPGKNTGLGCHFLLQWIFPTQGFHLCLLHILHWQAGSLPLGHLGGGNQCAVSQHQPSILLGFQSSLGSLSSC